MTIKEVEQKGVIGYSNQTQGMCWVSNHPKITPDSQEQTLYHELVHLILSHMNENKLTKNEQFVDTFAGLLHQFLKTRKH